MTVIACAKYGDELGFRPALGLGIFFLCLMGEFKPWARAFATIGIAWFCIRIQNESRRNRSDTLFELFLSFRAIDECLHTILLWPENLARYLYGAFTSKPQFCSFRVLLQQRIDQYARDEFHYNDWANDRRDSERLRAWWHSLVTTEAERSSRGARELPGELVRDVRTTAACGGTAVVLATTGVDALAATTNAATAAVSTTAWFTGISESTASKKQEPWLEGRAWTTATFPESKLTAFADTDFLAPWSQDFLKQVSLTLNIGPNTQIRAGRMFVAGCWLLPAPFQQETINPPRLPYSFGAYAAQTETRASGWHLITDLSGHSGLDFARSGQFDRLEESLHLDRDIGPHDTIGFSMQASPNFLHTSLNYVSHPTTEIDLRGMVYTSVTRSAPTTWGGYNYVGIRPFRRFPQMELHGQADYLASPDRTVSPLILTGGIRWVLDPKLGRLSATFDYQAGFGSSRSRGTDSLLLRLQKQF